jgi:hypothetical protein
MTDQVRPASASEELRAALEALAAFDSATLVREDGSANEQAQLQLARLQKRADTALERVRGF